MVNLSGHDDSHYYKVNYSILVDKLLQDDEAAQQEFVEHFLPIAMGYVHKRFNSLDGEAEDIALDALDAALRAIKHFDVKKGSLFFWVQRQVKWHAAAQLRQRNHSTPQHQTLATAPLAAQVHSRSDAWSRLAQLTPDEQRLLMLHYVDHMSYRAIAEQWGSSHTTVATKIKAILTKLSQ